MSESTLTAFETLSIEAALFSTLSALFGVYFVLFILAMWSTYRRPSKANTRLRIITLLLFFDLCIHYIVRAITLAQGRSPNVPGNNFLVRYIPIFFVACITTTTAGLISDGLLAWRMYVIYGRTRWALWVPASGVILTAMVGFVSDFQILDAYRSVNSYNTRYEKVSFQVNAAWGWVMLATTTMMTASILGRIIYVTRRAKAEDFVTMRVGAYSRLIEAIVESALVTWSGLVFYGISTVAPQGHITTNMNIGFVMICVVPIFFGISQCLITVRLGLASSSSSECLTNRRTQNTNGNCSKGIIVSIERTAATHNDPGHPLDEKYRNLAAESDSERSSATEVERV